VNNSPGRLSTSTRLYILGSYYKSGGARGSDITFNHILQKFFRGSNYLVKTRRSKHHCCKEDHIDLQSVFSRPQNSNHPSIAPKLYPIVKLITPLLYQESRCNASLWPLCTSRSPSTPESHRRSKQHNDGPPKHRIHKERQLPIFLTATKRHVDRQAGSSVSLSPSLLFSASHVLRCACHPRVS